MACCPKYKVVVIGAAGGIGQPLSLLLSIDDSVKELNMFDVLNVGASVDVSHIPRRVHVKGFQPKNREETETLEECVDGADFILIVGGVATPPGFKPGDTFDRSKLFDINGSIVQGVGLACAKKCPNAHILIVTNPVNSTVPVMHETLLSKGVKRPNVYGLTMLDCIRAMKFVGDMKNLDPKSIWIDIVGGHSAETMVPLFSTFKEAKFTESEIKELTQHVKFGANDVVTAKESKGSATLSTAFAIAQFYERLRLSLEGKSDKINGSVIAYTRNPNYDSITDGYMAVPLKFNKDGVDSYGEVPKDITPFEKKVLDDAIMQIKMDVEMAKKFLESHPK